MAGLASICSYVSPSVPEIVLNELQNKIITQVHQDRQDEYDVLSEKLDVITKELKHFTVKGDKSLVDQIPPDADWDLRSGVIFMVVSPPSDGDLSIRIQSKTTKAFLDFRISSQSARFIYHKPKLGTISKEGSISSADFGDARRLILVGFTWNLAEEEVKIRINGRDRA